MRADTVSSTPFGFVAYTAIATVLSFLISSVYGIIALLLAYGAGREYLLFAIIFLASFSLAKSQDLAKRHQMYSTDAEYSTSKKAIGVLVNVIYVNVVLFTAIVLGRTISMSVGVEIGLLVGATSMALYGFWEIETRARGLPISVGGVLLWILAALYLTISMTATLVRWLKRNQFDEILGALKSIREGIIGATSASEESPIYLTARRFLY